MHTETLPWLAFEDAFNREMDCLDPSVRETVRNAAMKASDDVTTRDAFAHLLDYGRHVLIHAREMGECRFSAFRIDIKTARALHAELSRVLGASS